MLGADAGVTASGMFEAGIGKTRVRGRVFYIIKRACQYFFS